MPTKPNIIWVFLDQCRADVLGCYGHPFIRTPNLDRLARAGVLFENAFSQNPVCVPSRVSILSGRYPHQTGVWHNTDRMDPADSHLLSAFNNAGYALASIGKVHLGISPREAGFHTHKRIEHNGIPHCAIPENYPEDWPAGQFDVPGYPQPVIYATDLCPREETYCARGVDDAISILDSHPFDDCPLMLRLSLDRPHTPVTSPKPYDRMYLDHTALPQIDEAELTAQPSQVVRQRTERNWHQFTEEHVRYVRAYYYGLVTHLDAELGRLFDAVQHSPQADNTILAVSIDHGCMLGEHGLYVKGPHYYTETSRVPLLLAWPGHLPAGHRVPGLVEMVDLLPTFCELAGIDAPTQCMGESLVPLIHGQRPPRTDVFAEQKYLGVQWQALRNERFSYIHYIETDEERLFDVVTDPHEQHDLAAKPDFRTPLEAMRHRLRSRLDNT